jgi:hypothetical protein
MSPEALAKPTITKNSSEFKLDAYASIPAGELVVFAVQVLQADGIPVAVEEVVSTCFRFFPHNFALKNYFYWPDSALVTRRLHDAKEKGQLKGSPTEGYETRVKGRQIAKQTAKLLGVSLPVPPKVEMPEPIVKKEEEKKEVTPSARVVKEVEKRETKKKEVRQKPKAAKPEKKVTAQKQAVKPKAQAKPKKEVTKVAVPVKKKPVAEVVKKEERRKTVKPVVKPNKPEPKPKAKTLVKPVAKVEKKEERRKKEVVKVTPKAKVEKPTAQKVKVAQVTQLTMSLTPPAAWKKAEVPAGKPKVKDEAQLKPVKVEVLAPVAASKEEKDKAAKVIKQLERSDAYQLYRRNGRRAQIGEFDFRNMLYATMESSAETLKRNLELFKRYAGIHFRTDLIAFLDFCEEHFASLMKSKAKLKR